jgi:hypothetical protein
MVKETLTWKDWEAEYICDQIEKLCQGFGLEVDWSDFAGVRTFGDLCDTICVTVAWRYRDGGRLQQVFHKLRKAIADVTGVNNVDIKPDTRFEELFPRNGRRRLVRQLETELGFRLHMLEARRWISVTLVLVMIVSFFSILLWWQIGLAGFLTGFFGFWVGVWSGREFRYPTVDELAMELMQNGFIFARKKPARGGARFGEVAGCTSPEAIMKLIEDTFRRELQLAPQELRRDVEIF